MKPVNATTTTRSSTKSTKKKSRIKKRVYIIRHGETNWNVKGKIQGGGFDIPLNENGKLQALKAAEFLKDVPFDLIASSSLSRAKETADIIYTHQVAHYNNARMTTKSITTKSTMCLISDDSKVMNYTTTKNVAPPLPKRIIDDGFNEMSFGEFEGLSYTNERFQIVKRNVANDPMFPFPSRSKQNIDGRHICADNDDDDDEGTDNEFEIDEGKGEGESTRIVEERSLKALSKIITMKKKKNITASSKSDLTLDDVLVDTSTNNDDDDDEEEVQYIAIVSHGRTNKIMIASMIYGDAHPHFQTIKQGNTAINILDYYEVDDSDDNVDDDSSNNNNNAEVDDSKSTKNTMKTKWIAQKLNYIDHVKGHVITK
ncbi:phosphoglycerate mutase-like protein [Fragilariopsis cylindrus CCMP1102]|uniref:Phosphoglycerate mutase-like protein n=1 Tax=Fragilariopsis cylindrus CCMP1102 TaxID=635003 RepID=A0A1E7FAK6_9STRA|nr:phosphoglycerate mutase-like protein [Fragilariopsis cylindrus CCMP1102]|eukprot:OEU15045.1 phosphoglycerate mutase-like protein [Fragilariopsis cylindrus CCMP1102]